MHQFNLLTNPLVKFLNLNIRLFLPHQPHQILQAITHLTWIVLGTITFNQFLALQNYCKIFSISNQQQYHQGLVKYQRVVCVLCCILVLLLTLRISLTCFDYFVSMIYLIYIIIGFHLVVHYFRQVNLNFKDQKNHYLIQSNLPFFLIFTAFTSITYS